MTAEQLLQASKPFHGKKGRDLNDPKLFALRFWHEKDRDAFVATLPAADVYAKGPCDDAEYYWVWVRVST